MAESRDQDAAVGPVDTLLTWCECHERGVLLGLVTVAVLLRALLVANAPPFGYVWDFYHEGVIVLAREGRLPVAADCWQCYHPPLFYVAGWPFLVVGQWLNPGNPDAALRALGGLSLLSVAIVVGYGYRILRGLGHRGASLIGGTALLVASPLLFISSFGAEADIVLTALLTMFLFHFVRAHARAGGITWRDALTLGGLAGLAAATKYSGLVALASAGAVTVVALIRARGPGRAPIVGRAAVIALIAVVAGGSAYLDNWRRYGTPMHANGSASEGLGLALPSNRGGYEFASFRWTQLRALFGPRPASGELTEFPVYKSVLTTLHAQAWSDMSFFSVPSRHGAPGDPYPRKTVPVNLTMAVIGLGVIPELLAVIGLAATWRGRSSSALAVFSIVTVAAYVVWFLPQVHWALKTKYILCLLVPGVAFAMEGQIWLWRRLPTVGAITGAGLVALVAAAHLYLFAFAMGRL